MYFIKTLQFSTLGARSAPRELLRGLLRELRRELLGGITKGDYLGEYLDHFWALIFSKKIKLEIAGRWCPNNIFWKVRSADLSIG